MGGGGGQGHDQGHGQGHIMKGLRTLCGLAVGGVVGGGPIRGISFA